jgi:hypothetical protein
MVRGELCKKEVRKMPDVLDMVKQYLIDNGYDGLYCEDCGCFIGDLVPCSEDFSCCMPGYKCKVKGQGGDGECDGIGPEKTEDKGCTCQENEYYQLLRDANCPIHGKGGNPDA